MSDTDENTPILDPVVNYVKPNRRRCSSYIASIVNETPLPNGATDTDTADGHCHKGKKHGGLDRKARKRLIIASMLCLIFMLAEIVGGFLAHSLAIVSDAAHLLTDLASFLFSLFAIHLASRKRTKKLSFGWHRAEILGALVSILMLWILTGILVYMAVRRVIDQDFEINSVIMLITASVGVVINIILGFTLHQHGHTHGGGSHSHRKPSHSDPESAYDSSSNIQDGIMGDDDQDQLTSSTESRSLENGSSRSYGSLNSSQSVKKGGDHSAGHKHHGSNINVKAAFIHVIGDLIQSIGVLVAALIIYFKPDYKLADPICTFVFSVIVLFTTLTIFRDILVVLMEGMPKGINFNEVRQEFMKIPGVQDAHDLRIWSLSMDKLALSVHIAIKKDKNSQEVLQQATAMVQQKFGIMETTIQVEEYIEEMMNCTQCQDLTD